MRIIRYVVVIAVLAGCAVLAWHLATWKRPGPGQAGKEGGAPPVGTRPLELPDSASCKGCHPGVYEEWYASHHRMAYVNPEVQRLSQQFQNRDCLPCHLPRPEFETGLGERVLERSTRKGEGVDCFACHRSGNACLGLGPLTAAAATAPCNPVVFAELSSMTLCTPCHDQHKVNKDWKETRFAVQGPGYKDCNDCHMKPVERTRPHGRRAPGRGHLFPGAHDAEMIRSAATFTAARGKGREVVVQVENTGAGHAFPADERHRAVDLEITVSDGGGRSATLRVDRYRNPYREEFGIKNPLREPDARATWVKPIEGFGVARIEAHRVPAAFNPVRPTYYPESTQIAAGEARSYRISLPPEVKDAHLELWYRANPYQPDDESILVAEKTFSLDE